jgi:hypothetical protein
VLSRHRESEEEGGAWKAKLRPKSLLSNHTVHKHSEQARAERDKKSTLKDPENKRSSYGIAMLLSQERIFTIHGI